MVAAIGYWSTRALISALGLAGVAWIWYSAIAAIPPLEWHGSVVYPTKVRAGDEITISRQFTVNRDIIVDIQRRLVSGDCNSTTGCRQYNLAPSTFLITKGQYNRTLPHTVPDYVTPGIYRLEFELHWYNALGYRYAVRHPLLYVEIVK